MAATVNAWAMVSVWTSMLSPRMLRMAHCAPFAPETDEYDALSVAAHDEPDTAARWAWLGSLAEWP